jgi:hypothetical protein
LEFSSKGQFIALDAATRSQCGIAEISYLQRKKQ